MLKSYLKIALRMLIRNRTYSIVNVLGLSLGICSCLVIWLIAYYEFSFDRFHPDKDRIYRINTYEQYTKDDPAHLLPCVLPSFSAAVRSGIPGVETAAPYYVFFDAQAGTVGKGASRAVFPCTPLVTGPEYFAIMKYEWLAGSEQTALSEPYNVVLTEKTAHTYFGEGPLNAMIGRELVYNDSLHVTVTGIVRDWKGNTDFPYTQFISIKTADRPFLREALELDAEKGVPFSSRLLVELGKEVTPGTVQTALSALFDKNWRNPRLVRVALQPLAAIHFTETEGSTEIRTANLPVLYTLMSIAVFILLLAVINYINLATAQSIGRDKEIGIRKVLGSGRPRLILQFLSETFLLALFGTGLASLLINPVLAAFRPFIPAGVQFHPTSPATLAFLTGITVVTTLSAGLYPARSISVMPVLNLRGAVTAKGSERWLLRKGLIVFQFTISLIFIIGTMTIGRQIRFMLHTDQVSVQMPLSHSARMTAPIWTK